MHRRSTVEFLPFSTVRSVSLIDGFSLRWRRLSSSQFCNNTNLVFVQTAVSCEEVVSQEPQRGAVAGGGQAERVERPLLCALKPKRGWIINEHLKLKYTYYRQQIRRTSVLLTNNFLMVLGSYDHEITDSFLAQYVTVKNVSLGVPRTNSIRRNTLTGTVHGVPSGL